MRRNKVLLRSTLVLVLLLPAAAAAQSGSAALRATVWRDPGDVSTLDLFYGAGGKERAPDPNGKYTFVKEDMDGGSPKFSVRDGQGVEWKVKLGPETQSETAATRLLWAAGYFVDEDYYLPSLKVEGIPRLRRGQKMVSADGTVRGARLERGTNVETLGTWDWFRNECGSPQELNGLRVIMAFLNNWDLKATNNTLVEADGQRRCVVTDMGATFGRTGDIFNRSKNVEKDYAASKFISKVRPESVDIVMHSRPYFLIVVYFPYYRARSRMEKVAKDIPLADARWVGQRLALLSASQIQDSFRAAGYTPEQTDAYTKAVQNRIAQLNAL